MRISDWSSDVCSSDLLTGHRGCVKLWRWSNAKGGGDDRRDDNPGRPERGRLSGGRSFSQRVRRTGRVCSERDFRGPGTWRDGEAFVVRQLLGPREGGAHRSQSEEGGGGAATAERSSGMTGT